MSTSSADWYTNELGLGDLSSTITRLADARDTRHGVKIELIRNSDIYGSTRKVFVNQTVLSKVFVIIIH